MQIGSKYGCWLRGSVGTLVTTIVPLLYRLNDIIISQGITGYGKFRKTNYVCSFSYGFQDKRLDPVEISFNLARGAIHADSGYSQIIHINIFLITMFPTQAVMKPIFPVTTHTIS